MLRYVEPERGDRREGDGAFARRPLRLLAYARAASRAARPSTCACRMRMSVRSRSNRTCPTRRSGLSDTVAVWGCGPVAQFAIKSAWMLGASRVIAIDRVAERLEMARNDGKAQTIDFDKQDVYETLQELTNGRGPDRCIDAVGGEAVRHVPRQEGQVHQGGPDPLSESACERP